MTMLSLGQAARAAGISKATLSKALASGRVSYVSKTPAGFQIDPSEVFRVFPPKHHLTVSGDQSETPTNGLQITMREHEMLVAQIEDLRADRDAWREQAQRLALSPPATPSSPVRETGGRLFRWLR